MCTVRHKTYYQPFSTRAEHLLSNVKNNNQPSWLATDLAGNVAVQHKTKPARTQKMSCRRYYTVVQLTMQYQISIIFPYTHDATMAVAAPFIDSACRRSVRKAKIGKKTTRYFNKG